MGPRRTPPVAGGTETIARTVTWRLPSGQFRTFAFAGTRTGSTFTGTLDDGERVENVSGTIASAGPDSFIHDGGAELVGVTVMGNLARRLPETVVGGGGVFMESGVVLASILWGNRGAPPHDL